jgi:hypothetical protein
MAADSSPSSARLLPLLFVIGIGLALLVGAVAAIPPWVLDQPVLGPVYERRETIVFIGLATAASIALGLLIALVGS